MAYPFVESPNVTRTNGREIDLVVVHTIEIAERVDAAERCARWFALPEAGVSAHYCVDAGSIVQCVRERDVAWHARGANDRSIGVELAGVAEQTRAEWEDDYSRAVLARAARLVSEVCERHSIPVRWVDAEGLRRGRGGITGHVNVSSAFRRSDHWDPGPAFPRDHFVELVRRSLRVSVRGA